MSKKDERYLIVNVDLRDRFKVMCKAEGRTVKGMVEHTVKTWEKKQGKNNA